MRYQWLNAFSRDSLKEILLPGQTPEGRVREIGENAENILGKPGFAAKFEDYCSRGWFSLSSPIWSNFGLDRGLPISCFGCYVSDSMHSILATHAEVGMQTKYGGGTSVYMGKVGPRGRVITDNGLSHGSVHLSRMFDTEIDVVSQGSTRRGNCAAYWPIDHGDIDEVLDIRTDGSKIQELLYGICVPDAWLADMVAGDSPKRKIWAKVIQRRIESGFPYLFFPDNANRYAPDVYRDQGLTITHSQMCVTGDQRVVSSRGLKTAKQLCEEGGELTLFDNDRVVKASPMRLIERDASVYRITLNNGMTHVVTDYHKVKVRGYYGNNGFTYKDVRCSELKEGDLVAVQTEKGLFGDKHMPDEAFLLGFYQGDGTQTDSSVYLDVWEKDFDLVVEIEETLDRIYESRGWTTSEVVVPGRGVHSRSRKVPSFSECRTAQSTVRKQRLGSCKLKQFGFEKAAIPQWIWESDEETQWQYIRGLFLTDGTAWVGKNGSNPLQVSLASVEKDFLRQVQLLLANLGMKTTIRIVREAGENLLPDGKGGHKLYQTRDCWRLILANKADAVEFNKHTGFLTRKGCVLEDREYQDNTKKCYAVMSVEYVGKEDVYCCTVDSSEHHWVCNGVITHNCTEIALPDGPEESFVCDLSSANIVKYDEWKDTDMIEVLTYLLDAVMTEFIRKARDVPFMERSVRFAERHRALGIGWVGYHSYLQSKMIPFESMEAKRENVKIAKTIQEQAHAASRKLALEYGEPEVCRGYGKRNATSTAIAPTKSSSFILEQISEGIELNHSNIDIKDRAKGKYTVKNRYLEALLESKGRNDRATWESITKRGGSVQHLDCLNAHEKAVFKTFAETSQMEVVQQAAQRQPYLDQGQSLNLMIGPGTPARDINKLLLEGHKLGLKSFYYHFGQNAAQNFARNILTCSSCEG